MVIKKNEQKERSLQVGLGEVKVIAINPTKSEVNALYGAEDKEEDKEIEYTGTTTIKYMENGEEKEKDVNFVNVDVWVEELTTSTKRPIRFTIKDFDRLNKDGLKHQYINQVGMCSWIDDSQNLASWFTKFTKNKKEIGDKAFRKAKVGEENLYLFLTHWLGVDKFNPELDMFLDLKKLLSGNVNELKGLLSENEDNTVLCVFGVRTKDVTEEDGSTTTKEYQSISNKFFCGGRYTKFARTYAQVNFAGLDTKTKGLYDLAKFIKDLQDSENGFKDFYGTKLDMLSVYNPADNPLNGGSALVNGEINETDSSYL